MTSAPKRSITTAFLFVVALLAGVNWYHLTRKIDTSPLRAATAPASTRTDATSLIPEVDISPESISDTLERPLFNAGRRPLPSIASAPLDRDQAKDSAPQSDALTLVGTMRWGNTHLALIRGASDPLARWISVGGTVDGWTLRGIERDFVVVERASRKVQIPIVQRTVPQSEGTPD